MSEGGNWIFMASSLLLALYGFRLHHIAGSPEEDIENTTQLVTISAYRYIRHPLYCSLLLGGFGAFLKAPSVLGFMLFTFVFIFAFVTAKVEERVISVAGGLLMQTQRKRLLEQF